MKKAEICREKGLRTQFFFCGVSNMNLGIFLWINFATCLWTLGSTFSLKGDLRWKWAVGLVYHDERFSAFWIKDFILH